MIRLTDIRGRLSRAITIAVAKVGWFYTAATLRLFLLSRAAIRWRKRRVAAVQNHVSLWVLRRSEAIYNRAMHYRLKRGWGASGHSYSPKVYIPRHRGHLR